MDSSIQLNLTPASKLKGLSFGKNGTFNILFVILGGLPLFLPVVWYIGEPTMAKNIPFDWVWWGNQIVSMPHVWATYARLNRKIAEGKVHRLYGIPAFLALLGVMIMSMASHTFMYVWTAVNVWQTFHYLRQGYGISRFFGKPTDETEQERKLCFWAYHLSMPLFIIGRWNMLYIAWRGITSGDIIPVMFPPLLIAMVWIVAGFGLMLGLGLEVIKYRRSREKYDCSGLLQLLVYFGIHWYGFLSLQNYVSGFFAVTAFHAIQYIAITWLLEAKQNTSATLQTRLLRRVPASLNFLAFFIALYAIGDFFSDHVFMFGNIFWPQFAAAALSTVSAHHYLADTALWNKKASI